MAWRAAAVQGLGRAGGLNLNEEYAKAFRTRSYAEFWNKVQSASADKETGESSSSQSPFHFYGVMAEGILEPDQESINAILKGGLPSRVPELYGLVSDYFRNSAEASKLCGALLKNIEQAKMNYRSIRNVLDCTPSTGDFTSDQCHFSITELHLFINVHNPFADPTAHNFQDIHQGYDSMLKTLEIHRRKVRTRLKIVKGCKRGGLILVIAASAGLAVCALVIASHALIAMVAGPVVLLHFPFRFRFRFKSFRLLRESVLARQRAQLDAAAKGTYILNRDFDTISRLVARLHDEVEHDKGIINFCLQRKDDRHPVQEVVGQLRRNDSNFNQQLDELEKHVYMCLMTINRARMLLVHEIVQLHN